MMKYLIWVLIWYTVIVFVYSLASTINELHIALKKRRDLQKEVDDLKRQLENQNT